MKSSARTLLLALGVVIGLMAFAPSVDARHGQRDAAPPLTVAPTTAPPTTVAPTTAPPTTVAPPVTTTTVAPPVTTTTVTPLCFNGLTPEYDPIVCQFLAMGGIIWSE